MVLAATELAAKVLPIRIPRMREEPDLTTAAGERTASQTGMLAQDGIQRQLILTNKRKGAVVLMPIPTKSEEFADGYDKNASLSVNILMLLCMSPSYSLDAIASRGRAGFFYGSTNTRPFRRSQAIPPLIAGSPHSFAQPVTSRYLPQTPYLEKRTRSHQAGFPQLLLFQVVAPFSRACPGHEE